MTDPPTRLALISTVQAHTYRKLRLDIEAALAIPGSDDLADRVWRETMEQEAARLSELEAEFTRDAQSR